MNNNEIKATLSIPMQIMVLRKAKFYLLREKRKDLISDYAKRGLCYYVFKALRNLSIHNNYMFKYNPFQDKDLDLFIPSFNRANAVNNANANPNEFFSYWWSKNDYENRFLFLDYLINNLQQRRND